MLDHEHDFSRLVAARTCLHSAHLEGQSATSTEPRPHLRPAAAAASFERRESVRGSRISTDFREGTSIPGTREEPAIRTSLGYREADLKLCALCAYVRCVDIWGRHVDLLDISRHTYPFLLARHSIAPHFGLSFFSVPSLVGSTVLAPSVGFGSCEHPQAKIGCDCLSLFGSSGVAYALNA